MRTVLLLVVSAIGCTTSVESVTSYDYGGSSTEIPLSGYAIEEINSVRVSVLNTFDRTVDDPAAGWTMTNIIYPNTTTPYLSGGRTYYGWSGTLQNLGADLWPNGGVARVKVAYLDDSGSFTGYTFDDLGCLDEFSGLSFEDRADACKSHVNGYLYLVDEDPVAPVDLGYLRRKKNPVGVGEDYYFRLDPFGNKATLAGWKTRNGFDPGAAGYEAQINARYFNEQDLRLGRDMNCVKKLTTNDMACYVTNYGDPVNGPAPGDDATAAVQAAVNRDVNGLLATVAMEYRPNASHNKITFYVFDANGDRVPEVELDSEGPKAVPGVCLSCHGGTLDRSTNDVTNAHFLPFDLDNFLYSTQSSFTRASQEDEFRALNRLVSLAKPTAAITEQLNGWYNTNLGPSGPVQQSHFVPVGWAEHEVLYREVVRPYCRGCHIALSELTLSTYDFNRYSDLSGLASVVQTKVCDVPDMPHAEVTREKFWQSPARGHLIGALNLPTACDGQ